MKSEHLSLDPDLQKTKQNSFLIFKKSAMEIVNNYLFLKKNPLICTFRDFIQYVVDGSSLYDKTNHALQQK